MHPKILLLHHDSVFEALLADFLVFCAYDVRPVYSIEDARRYCQADSFDIAVIDLANEDDCSFINLLTAEHPGMGILALVTPESRPAVLSRCVRPPEQCIDLPTPLVNILNKIKALVSSREASRLESLEPIRAGNLTINEQSATASVNGQPLNLTNTEFALLRLLAQNANQAVPKDVIYPNVLGRPHGQFDRAIDVHISSVRHKLQKAKADVSIESVRGVGYRLRH